MVDAPKTRLSKLRKHLAIPRPQYLDAVKRQEGRAWAKWTDPAWDVEMNKRFRAARKWLAEEHCVEVADPTWLPTVREADPALFDTEEEIRKDDKVITAYLFDNPTEARRPMARGTTHGELLDYWKTSSEGHRYFEQRDRQISEATKKLKAKYLGGADQT